MEAEPQIRAESRQLVPGGFRLGPSQIVGIVEDLAVEVGQAHRVAVRDAQSADTGRGQVVEDGGTQASGPHDQDPGGGQPPLSLDADPGQAQLALVPDKIFGDPFDGSPPPRGFHASRRYRAGPSS